MSLVSGIASGLDDMADQIDWGEAPDLRGFVGREVDIQRIITWLNDDNSRIIAVLGMGGIGKTAFTVKVIQTLVEANSHRFERILWLSLRNAPPLEEILRKAITFFGETSDIDPLAKVDQLIDVFIENLRQSHCLMVLDNLESILQPRTTAGQFEREHVF